MAQKNPQALVLDLALATVNVARQDLAGCVNLAMKPIPPAVLSPGRFSPPSVTEPKPHGFGRSLGYQPQQGSQTLRAGRSDDPTSGLLQASRSRGARWRYATSHRMTVATVTSTTSSAFGSSFVSDCQSLSDNDTNIMRFEALAAVRGGK